VRLAAALDVAERELARLLGVDASATRADRLAGVALADTSLPSRDALLASAIATSPALLAATRRADAAGRAVTAARSARWPSLHVVGRTQSYGDSDTDFTNEWNAGLQAQLPLFTGGAISSRVGQAQSARAAADADARLARARLEDDLDRALASREEARSRVASLATAVAQYEEVARIEKLRLDAEAGTQTDFLDAESELLVAEAQLVEARHAEIAARVELARITGTLDLAWIEGTLEAQP
jgi:outer membrane protein TolC